MPQIYELKKENIFLLRIIMMIIKVMMLLQKYIQNSKKRINICEKDNEQKLNEFFKKIHNKCKK